MLWHERLLVFVARFHVVSLEVNDQRISYMPSTEYVHESSINVVGEIDDAKTLYSLTVYPHTPVGHITIVSHDLDALTAAMADALGCTDMS